MSRIPASAHLRAALNLEVKLRIRFLWKNQEEVSSQVLPATGSGPGRRLGLARDPGIQAVVPGNSRVKSPRQGREQSSEPQGTLTAKAESEPGRTARWSRPVVLEGKKEEAYGSM